MSELKEEVGDNAKQQLIVARIETITAKGVKLLGEAKAEIDNPQSNSSL